MLRFRARHDVYSHYLQINCAVKEIPLSANDPRVGGADLKSYINAYKYLSCMNSIFKKLVRTTAMAMTNTTKRI